MRRWLLPVVVVACGEATITPTSSSDAAVEAAGYTCCVEGKSCATSEKIRWCAAPDAGPPGERCPLPDSQGCYMRANEAGVVDEAFLTSTLAPENALPDAVVECSNAGRAACGL